jgi:hypothetical protein
LKDDKALSKKRIDSFIAGTSSTVPFSDLKRSTTRQADIPDTYKDRMTGKLEDFDLAFGIVMQNIDK